MSQRRRALRLPDGTIIMDLIGADSGSENEDEDDTTNDGDDTEGDDDDEGDDDESEVSVEDLKAELAEARRAAEKAKRRMQNADRAKVAEVKKRQAAEAALAKKNGKGDTSDGDDETSASAEKKRIEDLERELADLKKPKPETVIYDEFREMDDVQWHDKKLAFSQLDLSEVDIEDDGTFDVEDLKDAIKKLVAAKPYLVKTTESSDDEVDEEADDKSNKNPSGQSFNGRKRSNSSKARSALAQKYRITDR